MVVDEEDGPTDEARDLDDPLGIVQRVVEARVAQRAVMSRCGDLCS